jgi:hypothetical protein
MKEWDDWHDGVEAELLRPGRRFLRAIVLLPVAGTGRVSVVVSANTGSIPDFGTRGFIRLSRGRSQGHPAAPVVTRRARATLRG